MLCATHASPAAGPASLALGVKRLGIALGAKELRFWGSHQATSWLPLPQDQKLSREHWTAAARQSMAH